MTTGTVANVIKANWQAPSVNHPLFPKRLFISKHRSFILLLTHSYAQGIPDYAPTLPVYAFGDNTLDPAIHHTDKTSKQR